jgi:hypothetical protein
VRKREKRKKKKICVEGRERKRESGALIVLILCNCAQIRKTLN